MDDNAPEKDTYIIDDLIVRAQIAFESEKGI